MTYSTGPGGYGGGGQGPSGQYGGQPAAYTQPTQAFGALPTPGQSEGRQTEGQGKSLPFFLNIAVAALGAITFLVGGFTETFFLPGLGLLLAAAAIAGFAMLPKQTALDVAVAGLSVAGFLALLFAFVGPDNGLISASLGYILVLVLAFAQSAIAVAIVLFSSDILKPPQPGQKPQQQYGYYGQGGGYGQPPGQAAGYGQVTQSPQGQPHQPYYGGGGGQTYQPQQQQPHQPGQNQPGQNQPPQQQW